MFDVDADPQESENLKEELPDRVGTLLSDLLSIVEESKGPSVVASPEIDDELRESLEALGYIQ